MACFLVPLTEGIVLSTVKKLAFKKNADSVIKAKLGHLENMLYGGSFLLAIEHYYHGELSFLPPFLTAMKTPEEIPLMLHEMATVGVGMALLTTAVWGVIVGINHALKKRRGLLLA